MFKHILITGGAGFVGINLAYHLSKKGYIVTIIDLADRFKRYQFLAKDKNLKLNFISADLSQVESQEKIESGIDIIIHLAAWPHVDFSYYYPKVTIQNNIMSLINVMDRAIKLNIPIIFSSSVEVYGGAEDFQYKETNFLNPMSPYGASKVSCEFLIRTYQRCYDLKSIVFRLTNLYGPYQLPDRIIPRFITRLQKKTYLDIECHVVRDFLHVNDAVKAIELMMNSNCWGEIFNVSTGIGTTMGEIGEEILKMDDLEGNVEYVIGHYDRQRGNSLNICNDKITQELGWKPEVEINQGLLDTTLWYKNNQEWWKSMEPCFMSDRKSKQFILDCQNNVQIMQ